MFDFFERRFEGLLKVPPQPDAPFGAAGSVMVFQAARGFFNYRLVGWALRQVILLLSIGLGLLSLSRASLEEVPGGQLFWIIELVTISSLLLQMPITFLMIALDFRYRWYIVTDRSLRIREGVWQVQERTMTFSNIQNISIRQGPVQRIFGIADLEVRTAGGGDQAMARQKHSKVADNLHVGYFRGVDNAEEIRDTILSRLRNLRASGLGDPDDPAVDEGPQGADTATAMPETAVLAAAQELLAEVRALRARSPTAGGDFSSTAGEIR